jgi:hypothetical protein
LSALKNLDSIVESAVMMLFHQLMSEVLNYLLALVIVPLVLMFVYVLFSLASFLHEMFLRSLSVDFSCVVSREVRRNPTVAVDSLLRIVMKELARVRSISRLAPVLGLGASMIPLGSVLLSGPETDFTGAEELLVVASVAVIVALFTTGIACTVLVVRRHWLLNEVDAYLDCSPDIEVSTAPLGQKKGPLEARLECPSARVPMLLCSSDQETADRTYRNSSYL